MSSAARLGMAATCFVVALLAGAWGVEGTLEIVPIAIFGVASLTAVGLLTRTYAGSGLGSPRATAHAATPAAG